jgi:hypothetical protein
MVCCNDGREAYMNLSREARLMAGLTVLVIPTVMYGGIALLGILTKNSMGLASSPP